MTSDNLTLIVEWSSAEPVRRARKQLGRDLKISQSHGEYIISVRQLPDSMKSASVKSASATLRRVRHDELKAARIENTTDNDMPVAACYFSSKDPVTTKDRAVTFQFKIPGIDCVASFSIPDMRYHGKLSLL